MGKVYVYVDALLRILLRMPPCHTRDGVHLIVCFVQGCKGIGSVHAPRVAGTNMMVELCRSFAIVPVVVTTLLCR
jgi:hypothetical protein